MTSSRREEVEERYLRFLRGLARSCEVSARPLRGLCEVLRGLARPLRGVARCCEVSVRSGEVREEVYVRSRLVEKLESMPGARSLV
jgi:hypothetical protein